METLDEHVLTLGTLNPNIIVLQYAVRGPIVNRAAELEKELSAGVEKPFPSVVRANSGDCHATGQKPITFIRQVLALCTYPDLLNLDIFPEDVKAKARRILDNCKGKSIGSYSDSCGIQVIREDIARYISERDGYPSDPSHIVMGTGTSDAIRSVMTLLLTAKGGNDRAGFMIPIPQYPLYSAAISEFGAYPIPYYLNEKNKWSLDVTELERSIAEARPHCQPRAIVVINPGNPTGSVLTKENIREVIKFAKREKLFILADEVYQHNIYAKGAAFFSFKQTLMQLGPPYDQMELASFMSASKGFMGECGYRGGYAEVINLLPEVRAHYYKYISAKVCPPIPGQAVLDCVVNPPKPGDPSYELFIREKDDVLAKLKEKATLITELFNSIEGISCNEVAGAMYAFPRIYLPEKAIKAAEAFGQTPDSFYCFALLEETGICTVPGSGFREEEGTFHFRTTILPPVAGAMYAFPRIYLPEKAIKAAEAVGQTPDSFYCFALLEETGICTVPGSGFREEEGTFHFRTTILPPIEELREVMASFKSFHLNFLAQYQ